MMSQATKYPPCAARLANLRKTAGLSHTIIAEALGITPEWAHDLDAYDEELFSTLDLAQVQRLAILLKVSVPYLLSVDNLPSAGTAVAFPDVVQHLAVFLQESGETADALGERLGWDFEGTLATPSMIWYWCVDELRDITSGIGLDWTRALPSEADLPPSGPAGG